MKRLRILVLAAVTPLAGCLHPAPPTPHATAAQIGPTPDNFSEAVIPAGGMIVLQGDDAIYGEARHGRRPPINGADERRGDHTLADSLHRILRDVTIVDHGFPGDTVERSAERWAGQPVGNLLILSFGYGDYRAKTKVADFTQALTKLVRQAQAERAAVFIITTPPTTSPQLFGLNDYRAAAQQVGVSQGVDVFDSTAALTNATTPPAKDEYGGAAIYSVIAGTMIPYIQIVAPAKAKS